MSIVRDNYEQYFLDHLEGNLSPEMERELSDFLDANPDLKQILDDYHPMPVTPEKIHNENLIKRLKKNITLTDHISEDNFEDWMIRSMEGFLSREEEDELNKFLELNPAYSYDQKIFGMTKLIPDEKLIFKGKEKLKRRGVILSLRQITFALSTAAAIVLLFIGIRYFQQDAVRFGTPSQFTETPSQINEVQPIDKQDYSGTPSQITETPSQAGKSLPQQSYAQSETPSQLNETPSRISSFRMDMSTAEAIVSAETSVSGFDPYIPAYTISPVQAMEVKEKSLFAKVFNNMLAKVKDGIVRNNDRDENGLPDFSIWTIAQASVKGYNSISDRDLELYVRKDEDGHVTSFALINDDKLLLERDLNRN